MHQAARWPMRVQTNQHHTVLSLPARARTHSHLRILLGSATAYPPAQLPALCSATAHGPVQLPAWCSATAHPPAPACLAWCWKSHGMYTARWCSGACEGQAPPNGARALHYTCRHAAWQPMLGLTQICPHLPYSLAVSKAAAYLAHT